MINIYTVLYCLKNNWTKTKHWILPVVASRISTPSQQGVHLQVQGGPRIWNGLLVASSSLVGVTEMCGTYLVSVWPAETFPIFTLSEAETPVQIQFLEPWNLGMELPDKIQDASQRWDKQQITF